MGDMLHAPNEVGWTYLIDDRTYDLLRSSRSKGAFRFFFKQSANVSNRHQTSIKYTAVPINSVHEEDIIMHNEESIY